MKKTELAVLQLIDSLEIGGAERMSVNIANALAKEGVNSFLCATRKGGALQELIAKDVGWMVLEKRSTFDIRALGRLVQFVREHHITVIHAHSSSFLTAVLVKPFTGVKIVWHDHYGNAELLDTRPLFALKTASRWFDAVISVNEKLATWAKEHLHVDRASVTYLPNFATLSPLHTNPVLPGSKEKRIACLANLRKQKDHMTLLKAFRQVHQADKTWHLLLVGEDREDTYSRELKQYIEAYDLQDNVHILGSRNDSADILLASSIGVLSSESEGLPVALLEYGLAGLAVVVTDVGQCADVVGYGKYGNVVASGDVDALAQTLLAMMAHQKKREMLGSALSTHILRTYGQEAVIQRLIQYYKEAG